ncbi:MULTISPECIES: tetratricopeptide repeat protein [unclassified Desulfovibrio]|uniref:tetratricopeptide repeat protein n=1 Tax=unclassified Desulfovibrio TaxID=2593640 RepID=UPI000F5F27D1|nr:MULTISPECIES: tetratricopeptide repeat protein [unclassified Desulfovibrio]RRD69723.1 diguanylate cyclase [Desulfovibrio sp. OH1209_COT-279]RRD86356.1 diguanylate cyclase [Desulfovibrio sp. OH1186_COT-070]
MKHLSFPDLEREHVMEAEGALCARLASFFSFTGHALYFPAGHAPDGPQLLSAERKLLLPLRHRERLLGVLMLHGVRVRELRPLMPHLPAIADLCLDTLAGLQAMRSDPATGLAAESTLLSRMEEAGERVRNHLQDAGADAVEPVPLHRLCMGLVLVRVGNGPAIARKAGHAVACDYLRALAGACREGLPTDVTAARVGRWEFAFLLSTDSRGVCHALAANVLARMEKVSPPSGQDACLCAGHALYPQDMQGGELPLAMFEQVRLCLDRARLAVDVAGHAAGLGAPNRIMPFVRILQDGGLVLETLPLGRVRISLGRQAKAREGMRFAVLDGTNGEGARSKGEVVLLRVSDTESVAEILHLADAACLPEVGDRLALMAQPSAAAPEVRMPSSRSGAQGGGSAVQAGSAEACAPDAGEACGHGEFLKAFARKAESASRFTLALLRLDSADAPPDGEGGHPSLPAALEAWRAACAGRPLPLAGRYGSNSLIFFHSDEEADALSPLYAEICSALAGKGISCAVGLAGYPFLRYRKAEMPDCALKALEYALLLPEPHVGVCNSLALNISADRRYSLGDIFGAVEEYKLALLADKGNAMAWNSLGVCMATLKRRHEARRHFLEALRCRPDTPTVVQICYNLGAVCQSLDERRAAARYFRQCVRLCPEHQFAHIRLGQLCELGGRRAEARRFYEKAAAIEDAHPQAPSVARRHLARVAARQRRGGEARELLHEALARNPHDADAMLLLAEIYLENNEDPAIAELLAGKSAALRDRPEAWHTLARALRALDRDEEARQAETRAVLS